MKQILFVIGFILLCFAGIAGISSWPQLQTSVGYYKIGTNPFGVAIYQDGLHNSIQFTGATGFSVRNNIISIPGTTTLVFGRDDIVFNATYIYTQPTQEQIDFLKKVKTSATTLPDTVFLVNPDIPGMLEFQGLDMRIDNAKKQITASGSIKVIVHDEILI